MNSDRYGLISVAIVLFATTDAAFGQQQTNLLQWHDARELTLEGKGWSDTKDFYDRLPARAQPTVRTQVWTLSHDSAGMCVRFVTDATAISARWTLRKESL